MRMQPSEVFGDPKDFVLHCQGGLYDRTSYVVLLPRRNYDVHVKAVFNALLNLEGICTTPPRDYAFGDFGLQFTIDPCFIHADLNPKIDRLKQYIQQAIDRVKPVVV